MKELPNTHTLNSSVEDLYKTYKSDPIENANIIVDLLKVMEDEDMKKLKKSVAAVFKIFSHLLKVGSLKVEVKGPKENDDPKQKYTQWLLERYNDIYTQLLNFVCDQKFTTTMREICLLTFLKLAQKEAQFPLTQESYLSIEFPVERLQLLYSRILLSETSNALVLKRLREYLQSPDFLAVSLHVLANIISSINKKQQPPFFLENLLFILEMITMPTAKTFMLPRPIFASHSNSPAEAREIAVNFQFPLSKAKQNFTKIWETTLMLRFDPSCYKRCLVILPEKVLMHLQQPVKLIDFFMSAFNMGGVQSILALHGMYILITQYNLDCPDFYDKLYNLFDPTIFHAKYRVRFFNLCANFFDSPYLPEYIIAAFIKKCSRLMLSAPSSSLILLMKFVSNLLGGYPSLKRLVENPNATSVDDDPFIADEPNPRFCRAGESSLWEIAVLQQHPLSNIAKAAKFILKSVPELEEDMSKCIRTTYEKVYENSCKIKTKRIATTFHNPAGLFKYSEDAMSSSWEIY